MPDPEEAFVPDCEFDIFLSYARDDNEWPTPPKSPADGWVHRFRETLRVYLDQKLRRHGGRVRFFTDTYSVRQQKDFQPQIDNGVSQAAVMVALVSDAWIGSEACLAEIALFDQTLGGEANQSGRLFPVHLENTRDLPPALAETLERVTGYDFYSIDSADQVSHRYRLGTEEFIRSLEVLRVRIAEQLIELRQDRQVRAGSPDPTAVTNDGDEPVASVYLAEAVGIKRTRQKLEAHFRSARIRVLPERPYPRNSEEYREALESELADCSVFVQIFGAVASTRTENLPRGYEGLQLDVATDLQMPILQWRDPQVNLDDVEESSHAEMAKKAEYFGELIEFAQAVREKVDRIARGGMPPDPSDQNQHWALIKADGVDDEYAASLSGFLAEHDICCRVTPNGLRTLDRLKEHHFDAVIIVYGNCDARWIDQRSDELVDVLQDRKDQAPVCGFYLNKPRTPPLVVKGIQQVVHQDRAMLQSLVTTILGQEDGQ